MSTHLCHGRKRGFHLFAPLKMRQTRKSPLSAHAPSVANLQHYMPLQWITAQCHCADHHPTQLKPCHTGTTPSTGLPCSHPSECVCVGLAIAGTAAPMAHIVSSGCSTEQ
jgi:hypothetical protein